jgi:H+/Cl- antiporter ClcA
MDIVLYIFIAILLVGSVLWLFDKVTPNSRGYNFSSKYGSSLFTVIIFIIVIIVIAFLVQRFLI